MKSKTRFCPKCGKTYTTYPALSRRDNRTEICGKCGTREALEDMNFTEPEIGEYYRDLDRYLQEHNATR